VATPSCSKSGHPVATTDTPKETVSYLPYFAREILGIPLYSWQAQALADIDAENSQVACKVANGSGKTTNIISPAVVWHALFHPGSKTVTTSGVFRQVKEQMWPRVREFARKFPGFITVNQTDFVVHHEATKDPLTGQKIDMESRCVGFSTDDPNRFEGWHGTSLLVALDEAKAIPDDIFGAVDRCSQGQPTRVLLTSSPGASVGKFYDAFHKDAALWRRHSATAYDCPHIPKEHIERTIQKWGIDHPLVRSMIFAEFMDAGGVQLVITPETWQQAVASTPVFRGRDKVAFCDFAAGGDENVFCVREGNKIINMSCWTEKNTMSAVGRFLMLFRKYGLQPNEVFGDGSGLGIPMCQALEEAGFPIHRVNNGSTAHDDRSFFNRGAEIWFSAARYIEQCEVVDLPDDEVLMAQATTRRTIYDSKGRLRLESKEDMQKRGIPSPDRADALLGCLGCNCIDGDIISKISRPSFMEMLSLQQADEASGGFDAGW
jgi:hypothetical protein